jgi:hypothetical protein
MCLVGAIAAASTTPNIDVAAHARASKKVIIATVTEVQSAFDVNDFGDRVIVSRVSLRVDEIMKGPAESTVVVTVEGGTIGDLTLSVSDMPRFSKGERAVLFLDDSARGGHVPHGRGAGVLKLDANNRVVDTTLTVDDIRSAVKASQGAGGR